MHSIMRKKLLQKLEGAEDSDNKIVQSKSPESIVNASIASVSDPSSKFQHFLKKEPRTIRSSDVASVFTYGECKAPIEHLSEARFDEEIKKKLKSKGYQMVYPIQSRAWNEICEGRAVTIINPKRSGKTMAFLPALLSLLVDIDIKEGNSHGPIAIIFASSSREIDLIYEVIVELTPSSFSAIKAYGKWNCDANQLELLNGCHLLITTPPCLLRLTKTTDSVQIFDRERICHLVFDNFDILMEKFKDDVSESLKVLTYGTEGNTKNPQIIVTSTKWLNNNEKMLEFSCYPLIIIGNNIEAALFAKSRFRIMRTSADEKREKLLNYLMKGSYYKKKTVIFVSNDSELNELARLLDRHLLIYNRLSSTDKNNETWHQSKDGRLFLILATDQSMLDYRLRKAQVIIHYTLPAMWSTFTKRFEASFEYYKSIIADGGIADEEKQPFVAVMMDENNMKEIGKIMNFLSDHRLINYVPENISTLIDKINVELERSKIELNENNEAVEICPWLMQMGKCNGYNCSKRHALINELDQPKYLPSNGKIKFSVLYVISPINFVIKITEISVSEDEWISWSEENEKIEKSLADMQKYFDECNNVTTKANVNVGDMCCYHHPSDIKWYRAKVLSKGALDEDHPMRPIEIVIFLIDKGETKKVNATYLIHLPHEFIKLRPLVFALRIVNFIPYDHDNQFDMQTVLKVESILKKALTKNSFNVAAIEFSIRDTAYSTNFHTLKHLRESDAWAVKFNLKKCLSENHYAIYDEEVYVRFRKIIKNLDAIDYVSTTIDRKCEVPKTEVFSEKTEVKVEQNTLEPPWINLQRDQIYDITLAHFESPDEFYIRLPGDYETLAERVSATLCEKPLKNFKEGTFCLLNTEFSNYRASILDESAIQVLLLDIGIKIECSKNDLYEMPPKLFEHPFLALKCKLSAIKPKFGKDSWDDRYSVGIKSEMRHMSKNLAFKLMLEKKIDRNYFEVSLYTIESEKNVVETLINEGLADTIHTNKISERKAAKQFMTKLESSEDAFNIALDAILPTLGFPETAKFIAPQSNNHKSVVQLRPFNNSNNSVEAQNDHREQLITPVYQHPNIQWFQHSALVCLEVDCKKALNYLLKIEEWSVYILVEYENSIKKVAKIELYGLIQPDCCSHSKNDNTIKIRLVKRSPESEWPRLTYSNERNNFIIYCANKVNPEINTEVKTNVEKPLIKLMPADWTDDEHDDDQNVNFIDELDAPDIKL